MFVIIFTQTGAFNAKTARRPLDQVTCFKVGVCTCMHVVDLLFSFQCGEKGHYANLCPQSFRAMQMGLIGSQAQHAANVGVKQLYCVTPCFL